jgi:bifunctional non-homologous end joining protein LigD
MKRNSDPALSDYRAKRDFTKTQEPAEAGPATKGRRFVIQKHAARRLHWDLRLQIGGVMASWAVPKEPPTKTGIRRLAIKVEDHPLSYADFEGEIPAGEYGAGTVEIWDNGAYELEGSLEQAIAEGKIHFNLRGSRLDGPYALIRLHGEEDDKDEWLFFRTEEDAIKHVELELPRARSRSLPEILEPQLCTQVDEPPSGEAWLHELKWDGYRLLCRIEGGKAICYSRNGKRIKLPELERELSVEDFEGCWLDGELVAFDEQGISSFNLIHKALPSKTSHLVYIAFDLPFCRGVDLRNEPLDKRKALLEKLVRGHASQRLRYSDHSQGSAEALYAAACKQGLEGVVSKKSTSKYRSVRSRDWLKIRCEKKLTGVVIGYTHLQGSRKSIGALLIAERGEGGELSYVGKVGTGFSDADRSELFERLEALRTQESPVAGMALPKGAFWVNPELEVLIQFLDWSSAGQMRQAKVLQMNPRSTTTSPSPKAKSKSSQPKAPPKKSLVSNEQRVLDDVSGVTKGELAAYYHAVESLILPHLKDRPVAVVRCPEGLAGQCFFQKHWITGLKEGIGRVDVDEQNDDPEPYMSIKSGAGIISLVQMGVIEFHPWGSTIRALEQPDQIIFDLDPDPSVSWDQVLAASEVVKNELDQLGLKAFVKVTGGKGIHFVVPIKPELEWPEVKRFCEVFAKGLAKKHPQQFTAVLSKKERKGRVFIDYLRNGRGATAVTAYSVRARDNMTVAMPIEWEEVAHTQPNQFTVRNAIEHIQNRKSDPWKEFGKKPVSLKKLLDL